MFGIGSRSFDFDYARIILCALQIEVCPAQWRVHEKFVQGPVRRSRDGRFGFGQRVERLGEEFVEVVELTALEIALDGGPRFQVV